MSKEELLREESQTKEKKTGKARGFTNFLKKMLVAACVGTCFGLFAGGGLYAVGETTGTFDAWQRISEADGERAQEPEATPENTELTAAVPPAAASQVTVAQTDNDGVVSQTGYTTAVTSDVSGVVEEMMPAMVSIVNNGVERMTYFGQVFEQDVTSSGSGIIVGQNETELLIATNYHVIADARTLTVYFVDDSEVNAVVKGSDQEMDLAVIAVPLEKMEAATRNAIHIARMGDSDNLKLGEPVVAIGNALGYGQSVTGGWISALNREVELSDGSTGIFIQTDAAINPGNSGGALINMNGEVIGINSNKIGGTVIEGIGYAIPISAAQPILENLMTIETRDKIEDGDTGYLGIVPQTVTEEAAAVYGMPQGVFVSRVEEGTPAEEAGLLKGDIITGMDGLKLLTAEELRDRLTYYHAGETVELTVMRSEEGEYRKITITVVLGSKENAQ